MPLAQACLIAGYRLSGKAYSAVKQMRADGLIEGENDNLDATALGRERLGDVQKLPKGKKLADWWQTRLGKLEGKLFEVIRTSGPISIQDACEQAEYKLSGKAYSAAKALRGKGIVVGDNSALSLHEKLR